MVISDKGKEMQIREEKARQPRSDLRVEKYCTFVPAGNELTITLDAGKNLYLVRGKAIVRPVMTDNDAQLKAKA
jgi:hypothetical protein